MTRLVVGPQRSGKTAAMLKRMAEELDEKDARIAELEAERDAAVADISHNCISCKHLSQKPKHGSCGWCGVEDNGWEWRGVG